MAYASHFRMDAFVGDIDHRLFWMVARYASIAVPGLVLIAFSVAVIQAGIGHFLSASVGAALGAFGIPLSLRLWNLIRGKTHVATEWIPKQVIHEAAQKVSVPTQFLSSGTTDASSGEEKLKGVLIVEDDDKFRDLMKQWMTDDATCVQVAGNVSDALRILRRQSAELIITDLNMPNASGMELVRRIRSEGKQIPTLIISGYAHADNFQNILSENDISPAGDIAFLEKPFSANDLKTVLNIVLRQTGQIRSECRVGR